VNEPLAATTPLSVTLEAQEWNNLIEIVQMAHAPWRVTNPLIQKLTQQVQVAADHFTSGTHTQPQPMLNGSTPTSPGG